MHFTIKKYTLLDSTNAEAMRLIEERKAVEGLVLQAEEQTEGKGAGQNRWESAPDKNLTFSLIVQPRFIHPSQQFVLTEMISLALFDALEKRLGNDKLRIKWPNDLWYDRNKLAGILIQNRIKGACLDFSVIGVGLNVNQKEFRSDAPNPASLAYFSGKEEKLPDLLNEILFRFDAYYEKLKTGIHTLDAPYLQRLYQMNKWAEYEDASGRFTAKITGVDSYGRLLLTGQNGKQRTYGFKEVRFLL